MRSSKTKKYCSQKESPYEGPMKGKNLKRSNIKDDSIIKRFVQSSDFLLKFCDLGWNVKSLINLNFITYTLRTRN